MSVTSSRQFIHQSLETMSFLDLLADELLFLVFEWVPPAQLVSSTSRVCKRFIGLIRQESFWKRHPVFQTIVKTNDQFTMEAIQRCCIWAAATKYVEKEEKAEPPACLHAGSVLVSQNVAREIFNAKGDRTCAASSTHNAHENLERVLALGHHVHRFEMWWSSGPSRTQDSTDVLLFVTKFPKVLMTRVLVKPLLDPFTRDVVYTWKKTVIRAYQLLDTPETAAHQIGEYPTFITGYPCRFRLTAKQDNKNNALLPNQGTIDGLIRGYKPVYESAHYGVPADSGKVLSYELPGVVANVITITLEGKNHEQFRGSGDYYACVKKADCHGIPLCVVTNRE